MKIYLFLIFLLIGFSACKSSPQKETTAQTPKAATSAKSKKIIHCVDNIAFAQQIANSLDAQLVDVRTPKEHKEGAIKNSVNVNYYDNDFAEQVSSKLDKNKPVLLYCAKGGRSAKAAKILEKEGFTEIYDLETGYKGWK